MIMKKLLYIVLIGIVLIVGGWFVYPMLQIRYFPIKQQRDAFEKFQSIIIRNDSRETVFAEFVRNGQAMSIACEADGTIVGTQGKVRIFVPEKKGFYPKGWYTIEYPYPYPLTKQTSWFIFGPRFVWVKLTDILQSRGLAAGLVDFADLIPVKIGLADDSERKLVHDIKVTFEPGEGPKEKK
jgi:hypothetical protein